jgi:hypothetical protein
MILRVEYHKGCGIAGKINKELGEVDEVLEEGHLRAGVMGPEVAVPVSYRVTSL